MTRATTPTKLSLDRYAKIMGIDPVHFSQAVGEDIFPVRSGCSDVWWQRSYQRSDVVSREELADAIYSAEQDIEDYLGFPLAPEWIVEMQQFPRPHRRQTYGTGRNVRLDRKSLIVKKGKFINSGRRYAALIGTATLAGAEMVWSDPIEGINTIMTITLPNTLSLTNNSYGQVKVYFDGESTREWEISEPRSLTIDAVNITIVFDFWKMIDPALQDELPSAGLEALDIGGDIYVETVDVYREYSDWSQHSVEFFWEDRGCNCGVSGCAACEAIIQCGCLHGRDVDRGIVVPVPANWDADELEWYNVEFDQCIEPDNCKIWYLAGDMSDDYVNHKTTDPLKRIYAQSIAEMATARLERNPCACGALSTLYTQLRTDLIMSSRGGATFFLADAERENPFGTRLGEVKAWRRFSKLTSKRPSFATV